jgi:hypothetical protein
MIHTTRNTTRALLSLAIIGLIAACASTPPTLAFYDESGMVGGNNPVPMSDMERERIDTALETAFRNKGYEILDEDNAAEADLLISWTLILNDKTDVRTYQTPATGMNMGYSRFGGYNRYSMYNCWSCTQTEVSVKNYTEGTFIVDMISPELKRSVWRSEVPSHGSN